ncbi:MAG: hypothetical protein GX809_05455 [Clostridiaceae bacterium]|nr:hypothetical protein [Clostridiaceae bacterium]
MAGKKKSGGKRQKSGFTPPELRLGKRFLSSVFGKLTIGLLTIVVVTLLAALIAGDKLQLFLLLTGIVLLAGIIVFWLLLLFKRAAGRP